MSSKLVKNLSKLVCYMLFLVTTLFLNSSHATTWSEVADAGDLLNTAQIPTGIGSLDTITGTITTSYDVDLYKISILSPATFSASVFGGESPNGWDSTLALFDENGLGVYMNDDANFDIGDSRLPPNHALGPQSTGNYYLAIYDDDLDPGSSVNNAIFAISVFPYTQINGPTGSGGNAPLAGWGSLLGEVPLNSTYGINLTGAEFVTSVPIPAAVLLFGSGVIGLIGGTRRIKHSNTMN